MTVEELIFILENRAYPECKVTLRNEEVPDDRAEVEEDDIDIYDDEVIIG